MKNAEPKHREWIKLWIKESLLGTVREDLTPEERGTWYDFILLAGNCRVPGVICANEKTALPVKRIAGILNIPETLVTRCIKKFKDSGRIEIDKNGVIHIQNWDKYQYTDYDRQKPYREAQREAGTSSATDDILDPEFKEMATLYENNIEMLTPILREKLIIIQETTPAGWFAKAVEEAVSHNARNLKYIEKVLENWKVNGLQPDKTKRPQSNERKQDYTFD